MNYCKKTLLLYMFLILAAPGGSALGQNHPWSFLPMCTGDETWWISVPDSGVGLGHCLPTFTSMRIDRDTLILWRRYYHINFPAESGIAEGWLRADSAGLFMWNGMAEQRLLPAYVSLGEGVNGEKVTDVTFVRTPFGDARSYTFGTGASSVTWTDGIGLWAFTRTEGGRSRRYTWFANNRCGETPHRDASGIIAPIRDGDILVHHLQSAEGTDLGYQVLSARRGSQGKEWIAATSMDDGRRQNRNFLIRMTPGGMVRYEGNDRYGVQPRFDHYPAFIPPVDNMTVGEDVMSVVARFDTTIFSETVAAYTLKSTRSSLDRVVTIADRFGVVYERVQGMVATLHSAVIGGKKYNRTPERWRYFPLCSGSSFAYRRIGPESNDVAFSFMRDTVVQGEAVVAFALPPMPADRASRLVHALDGEYRETTDGIRNGSGELVMPAAVDLGDRAPTGIVVASGEMELLGARRRYIATLDIDGQYSRVDTLVENIGWYYSRIDEDAGVAFEWRLLGGEICGIKVGVTSGMEAVAGHPTELQMALYPNPVTAGTPLHIAIESSSHGSGRLVMHDMLGRIVLDDMLPLTPGAVEIFRNTRNLSSGAYTVSITAGGTKVSKLLLLR